MRLDQIDVVQWILTISLAWVVLVAALRSRVRRQLPVFTSSLALTAVLQSLLALSYRFGYSSYYYAYWSITTFLFLFQFLVLKETLHEILRPYKSLPDRFSGVLSCSIFMAAAISIACSALAKSSAQDVLAVATFGIQRTLTTTWCACFIAVAANSSWMGIGWGRNSVAVSLGNSVISASGMMSGFLYTIFGYSHYKLFNRIDIGISHLVVCSWIIFLSRKQKSAAKEEPEGAMTLIRLLSNQPSIKISRGTR